MQITHAYRPVPEPFPNTPPRVDEDPRIGNAREQLILAQGAAADGSNDPVNVPAADLHAGAAAALIGVKLLSNATPTSPFQHLDEAISHAQDAIKFLQAAATTAELRDIVGPDETAAGLRKHAHAAFDRLEVALEILDND